MKITSFNPPQRTLLGPGPSDVSPQVLAAMGRPTIGHLDPMFVGLMDEVKQLLQYAYQTSNQLTMPVSAPGSAGMECCFANLLEPGDKAIVCINGVFGLRMQENIERCGAIAVVVGDDWGTPVSPEKLEDALKQHKDARLVAFVHAETSTGVVSDAETLTRIAHDHDCLVIVDAVTSLGGTPLKVDQWGLDAVYSGSQKCLSCVPGLSPITFGERALERIQERKQKVQSWFLDLNLVMGYWGEGQKRAYHHTAPINSIYALHESLLMLQQEGLENAWARHTKNHIALKLGLEAMGLELTVAAEHRLPQLNAVKIPHGVDDAAVRGQLLKDYNLEIGAGLGPFAGNVWRIGLMGYASNRKNVLFCLSALETVLASMGAPIKTGVAVHQAMRSLDG